MQFSLCCRYNWKDFSFEKDLHVYGPHDLECCGICRVRCTDQLCPSFYVTQSMLGAAAPIVIIFILVEIVLDSKKYVLISSYDLVIM